MGATFKVFEHKRLTIHDKVDGMALSKTQLNKLYDFNDKNDNKYFTGIRDGIKFKEYVGVIQIGDITIEILPKADRNENSDEESTNKWRKVLLKMLGYCNKINLETVSDANLSKRTNSLLDLYFERFINELEKLLHLGLIKKYRSESGNVTALKGQLQFAKHIQQNIVHKERFFTKHQVYDREHLVNQVLLRALIILSKVVRNPNLIDKTKRLLLNFPEIKEIQINSSHFDKIKLNRKSWGYQEALQIAKMIILNYSPDLKGGNENMIALLFDMNTLWEEYVYRMLLRVKQTTLRIQAQGVDHFWNNKMIRPDIVIEEIETKRNFIIDTKWKVIDNNQPSDDDLKQMYSYNQYWSAAKSILLYPNVNNIDSHFGVFHKGINGITLCKLGYIDVTLGDQLDLDIGTKILKKFEEKFDNM